MIFSQLWSKPNKGSNTLCTACEYPGESGFSPANDANGKKCCVVTTRSAVERVEKEENLTILYNPRNAAKLKWG